MTKNKPASQVDSKQDELAEILEDMPITAHLIELRGHLVKIFASVLLVFLAIVYFARDIYAWLSMPLQTHLPEGATMIATDVTSPFMAPIKLTMFVALFVAMPYVLHQIWQFIAPGLYKKEKGWRYPFYSPALFFFMSASLLLIFWFYQAYLSF